MPRGLAQATQLLAADVDAASGPKPDVRGLLPWHDALPNNAEPDANAASTDDARNVRLCSLDHADADATAKHHGSIWQLLAGTGPILVWGGSRQTAADAKLKWLLWSKSKLMPESINLLN